MEAHRPDLIEVMSPEEIAELDNMTAEERRAKDNSVTRVSFKNYLRRPSTTDGARLMSLLEDVGYPVGNTWKKARTEEVREVLDLKGMADERELFEKLHLEWKLEASTVPGTSVDLTSSFVNPASQYLDGCRFMIPKSTPVMCGEAVVPGTVRCARHGGELVDVQTRQAVLMTAYLELVGSAQVATRALLDVAENSRNDLARVAASKEILDRAGLTADLNVNITVGDKSTDPVAEMQERLMGIRDGLMARIRADGNDPLAVAIEMEKQQDGDDVVDVESTEE